MPTIAYIRLKSVGANMRFLPIYLLPMGEYVISSQAIIGTGGAQIMPEHDSSSALLSLRLRRKTAFYFLIRFDLVFVVRRYASLILLHSCSERRYTGVQQLKIGLSWPRLSLPLLANGGYLCWSHARYVSRRRAPLVSCVFLARRQTFAPSRLHV